MERATRPAVRPANPLSTIARAGVVAGILDGLDAAIVLGVFGVGVKRVFQYIASGVLGPASFQGGWLAAALGVAFHFIVAIGAATTYYLLSRWFSILIRKPIFCGPIFGLGVFVVMRYVVIPLSAVPKPRPLVGWGLVNQLIAHTVLVGLSIGLIVARADGEAQRESAAPERDRSRV